jgi:hypothetical protein
MVEVVIPETRIDFLSNRRHISVSISFTVLLHILKYRSSRVRSACIRSVGLDVSILLDHKNRCSFLCG